MLLILSEVIVDVLLSNVIVALSELVLKRNVRCHVRKGYVLNLLIRLFT